VVQVLGAVGPADVGRSTFEALPATVDVLVMEDDDVVVECGQALELGPDLDQLLDSRRSGVDGQDVSRRESVERH
jgi:hypothetical protein